MGLTQIEIDTMRMVQSACRTINKEKKIDWEQRRYEIAKDLLASYYQNKDLISAMSKNAITENVTTHEYAAEHAVEVADLLISKLKSQHK